MALCAYQTSNNYEHVIYVGLDNHVHELIYTGQWRHNDLTTAAKGAPPAAPGSALAWLPDLEQQRARDLHQHPRL